MFPLDGETADELAARLFQEWLYARGGNHPADVARWLNDYTPEQFASMYMETWGVIAEDEDYVPATPQQIADAAVELYEDDDAPP